MFNYDILLKSFNDTARAKQDKGNLQWRYDLCDPEKLNHYHSLFICKMVKIKLLRVDCLHLFPNSYIESLTSIAIVLGDKDIEK